MSYACLLAGLLARSGCWGWRALRAGRGLSVVALLAIASCLLGWSELALWADEPRQPEATLAEGGSAPDSDAPKSAADLPLTLPEGWPEGHPVPIVRSNCMACHLNAGRELSLAVHDFSRSTHDLNELTCYDCHGGNSVDDTTAHDSEFGFIGTKLSALLGKCAECHDEPAEELAGGPHHWDFKKRINTKYPMCLDCHGNHDVGNPPADFTLTAVCQDCHDDFEQAFPTYASVLSQNDRLWQSLMKVKQRNLPTSTGLPDEFADEVDRVRHRTMHIVHGVGELPAAEAEKLNAEAETLRGKLDKWLAEADLRASAAGSLNPETPPAVGQR